MPNELQYLSAAGELRDVPLETYPDTMPLVRGRDVGHGLVYLLRPKSLASFAAAMFYFDALVERFDFAPNLILPFVPGARQDRLNETGDFLFTIKSVAGMINARRFPSVTILDPHSDVAPALIDRCKVVHAAALINPPAGKYQAVISPDAGAEKRASAVAQKLGVPLIHAWKTRDVSTGAISGFGFDDYELEQVRGGGGDKPRVLIVDDICDGGGTFVGLANAIDLRFLSDAFDLHLWTTHGIYSKGIGALAALFSHIYCTDSIVDAPRDGVIEVSTAIKLLTGAL